MKTSPMADGVCLEQFMTMRAMVALEKCEGRIADARALMLSRERAMTIGQSPEEDARQGSAVLPATTDPGGREARSREEVLAALRLPVGRAAERWADMLGVTGRAREYAIRAFRKAVEKKSAELIKGAGSGGSKAQTARSHSSEQFPISPGAEPDKATAPEPSPRPLYRPPQEEFAATALCASTELAQALGFSNPQQVAETIWGAFASATRMGHAAEAAEWKRWIDALGFWIDSLAGTGTTDMVGATVTARAEDTGFSLHDPPRFRLRVSYLDRRIHAALAVRLHSNDQFRAPSDAHVMTHYTSARVARLLRVEAEDANDIASTLGLQTWNRSVHDLWSWSTDNLSVAASLADVVLNPSAAVRIEWETPKPRLLGVFRSDDLRVRGQRRSGWFDVNAAHVIAKYGITLLDLIRAVRTGVKYVEITPDAFVEITAELAHVLRPWAHFQPQGGMLQIPALAALATAGQLAQCSGDLGDAVSAMKSAMQEPIDLPTAASDLRLHDYQKDGVRWLLRLALWAPGACLADDMGLGKTRQLLCLLAARAHIGPALVVAPASLVEHWSAGADTKLLLAGGSPLDFVRAPKAALGPGSVVVLSYDKAAKLSDHLAEWKWSTAVYDEAHYLKNPGARRTRALLRIKADFTVAATGTPLENHIGELWSIAQFFAPGWLGNRKEFRERYLPADEAMQEGASKALAATLPVFMLRRRRSDHVAELPNLLEYNEEIEMRTHEAKQYREKQLLADKTIQSTLAALPEAQKRIRALELLRQLREAAAHPALIDDGHGDNSSKVDWLVEQLVLDRADGAKALVFSQWARVLDILERVLAARGISTARIDGSLTASQRSSAIQEFAAGRADVLLLTLGAGGVGLNLQAASRVYMFDPWWNPQKELQAVCRAHRQGQRKEVVAVHLIAPQTVEQKLIELQARKRDIFDAVMEGSEVALKLSTDEIIELLGGRLLSQG